MDSWKRYIMLGFPDCEYNFPLCWLILYFPDVYFSHTARVEADLKDIEGCLNHMNASLECFQHKLDIEAAAVA